MASGLSYQETLDLPVGELLDYMSIYQIKRDGFRPKLSVPRDDEIIPDVR